MVFVIGDSIPDSNDMLLSSTSCAVCVQPSLRRQVAYSGHLKDVRGLSGRRRGRVCPPVDSGLILINPGLRAIRKEVFRAVGVQFELHDP